MFGFYPLICVRANKEKEQYLFRRLNNSLDTVAFFIDVLFATVVFSQSSSCFEEIPRLWAEGWLNCSNLEVPENFKVSCSATEKA